MSVSVFPRSCLGYRRVAFWAFKRRGCAQFYWELSLDRRVLKMSSDPAVTVWLARPFHSGIVLTKKDCLYWSDPLLVGIWKALLLFVTYCSTMFLETQSLKFLAVIFLLFWISFRYLSGGIAGVNPTTILNKKDSLRFLLLDWRVARSSSFSILVTQPGSLER